MTEERKKQIIESVKELSEICYQNDYCDQCPFYDSTRKHQSFCIFKMNEDVPSDIKVY